MHALHIRLELDRDERDPFLIALAGLGGPAALAAFLSGLSFLAAIRAIIISDARTGHRERACAVHAVVAESSFVARAVGELERAPPIFFAIPPRIIFFLAATPPRIIFFDAILVLPFISEFPSI